MSIKDIIWQLDGKPIGVPLTVAPYSLSLNTTQHVNGLHTVSVVAKDVAGNSTTKSVSVMFNNLIPILVSLFDNNSINWNNTVITQLSQKHGHHWNVRVY
jgi:hypothetical protein